MAHLISFDDNDGSAPSPSSRSTSGIDVSLLAGEGSELGEDTFREHDLTASFAALQMTRKDERTDFVKSQFPHQLRVSFIHSFAPF